MLKLPEPPRWVLVVVYLFFLSLFIAVSVHLLLTLIRLVTIHN